MSSRSLRVLLVDDDSEYATFVAKELESAPLEIVRADSLDSACRAIASERFDAILLDLGLPDSRGLDTVARVADVSHDVPIVVLTAEPDDSMGIQAVQRGADDYLPKQTTRGDDLVRSLRYSRERAAMRRSLRNREARFRALVENSYDAITLVDERYYIVYDSRSVERVTGFTPEERLGHRVDEFLHPDDVPDIAERFFYSLTHPDEVIHVEFRYLHKDGAYRWGEAIGVNRLNDPAVQAIVVNHRDISDRLAIEQRLRVSEEQLRQAQKMEAVGRLAGGVAHDFNNVLTAIFGYSDLLLEEFPLDDPRRADVQEIRRSAERAATLTRQLLAFSRKQVMQPRVLNLNDVISNVQSLLRRLVGEDIEVQLDLRKELIPVVADPGQMEQVLMNLAANARDAMPEGGQLKISTSNVQIESVPFERPGLKSGHYAALTVHDTGTGMPDHVRTHIFEPFFTTKEQGKGTGLGLATVYGIVKQSGGGIYVESGEGQGTTFVIYLPTPPAEVVTSSL
jgi:two-component system, cell cycle sensor histidine kinase and response regulator CckA